MVKSIRFTVDYIIRQIYAPESLLLALGQVFKTLLSSMFLWFINDKCVSIGKLMHYYI